MKKYKKHKKRKTPIFLMRLGYQIHPGDPILLLVHPWDLKLAKIGTQPQPVFSGVLLWLGLSGVSMCDRRDGNRDVRHVCFSFQGFPFYLVP